MKKLINIKNNSLSVSVSSFGAEIQSIVDAKGTEWIWQGNSDIWPERAPILFPVCGGLKDDHYILNNKVYSLPKHGFARLNQWDVEEVSASSVTFLLTKTDPGFPFSYELRAHFCVSDNTLGVSYNVKNTGNEVFCYCMGAHEGYLLHYPLNKYEIKFPQKEDLLLSKQIGNLIVHEETLLSKWTEILSLESRLFEKGALIFRSLKSRSLTLVCKKDKSRVSIRYPDFDVLILWTKSDAGFLCIEPWTSFPDFIDSDGLIIHKPGSILLEPGEEKTLYHEAEFQLSL